MKLITLAALAALAGNAHAAFSLGSDGPLVPSYWHGDHWDHNGIHQDPVAAPEASPTIIVALAGAALIMRRNGGAK